MRNLCVFLIFLSALHVAFGQIKVIDSLSKYPVSYATISFGNGQGIFADDDGMFVFNKKLYPDVDSLFISALGYRAITLTSSQLEPQLFLQPKADELDEVVISAHIETKTSKPYKTERLKPYLDDDYYKCWLPTIESEIAVFFPNTDARTKQVMAVQFPIALESRDWNKRKRANTDKKRFSTLFKVKFYGNNNGKPDKPLTYKTIVFRTTEKDGDFYDLVVADYDIFVPKDGIYVSLQVLGYTDKNGKLLPNKKYKEIKGRQGMVKIPTNFRPLLPFTDEIETHNTYIKRVFINGNDWQVFKKGNGIKSTLLDKGLNNYGVGMRFGIYKDE